MTARLLALETQLQQQREAAAAAVAAERQRREAAAAVSRRYALLWRHQSDRALLMCCLAAWRTEVTEAKEMRRKVCAMLCYAVAVLCCAVLCHASPPPPTPLTLFCLWLARPPPACVGGITPA